MFKKDIRPIKKGGQVAAHAGKGAVEQHLPSRSALNTITSGPPAARSMNDYAKATPMASPDSDTPDIFGG